jgi:hypothetical protein
VTAPARVHFLEGQRRGAEIMVGWRLVTTTWASVMVAGAIDPTNEAGALHTTNGPERTPGRFLSPQSGLRSLPLSPPPPPDIPPPQSLKKK